MSNEPEDLLIVDQLANELRKEIISGKYGTSGTLPSTTALHERWGKARSVVTQVMLQLASEGWIRIVGNRYVVSPAHIKIPGFTRNFEEYLQEHGFTTVIENLKEPELELLPPDLAKLFKQPEGVHMVHRMRKQSVSEPGIPDQPLRVEDNWYPAHLAEVFLEEMRTNNAIDMLAAIKEKYGIFMTTVQEDTYARIPTIQERNWLDLARYQTVFVIVRRNFASDGQPVMFHRAIMVASNFVLSREYSIDHWS